MPITTEQIRLISINEGKTLDDKPAHLLRMGYVPQTGREPMLTVEWDIPKTCDDADAVRLARHYFHCLCQTLGEVSAPWGMEEHEARCLRVETRSLSARFAAKS